MCHHVSFGSTDVDETTIANKRRNHVGPSNIRNDVRMRLAKLTGSWTGALAYHALLKLARSTTRPEPKGTNREPGVYYDLFYQTA